MHIRGVTVKFLSRTVTFYPLTIGQIQSLGEELKALLGVANGADAFEGDRFAKLVRIYTASAKRGDPTITEEIVNEIVDMGNIQHVNAAVLGQSGLLADGDEADSTRPTNPPTGG